MDFLEELNSSVLCGDGAMGTELMSSGVPVEVCFEELNVSAPELVSRIHDSYVQAGARLIETNTFGANAARLARHGLQSRVQELNQAAIRLARKSIGQRSIYLAASIGPLGIADPQAEFQEIDRANLFEEQAKAILEAEVDVLILETFLDFEEIQIALNAVRTLDTKIPVICSMVCSEEGRLPSSLPIVQAFRELIRLGANVIGVNCVTGPNAMSRILRRIPLEFPISAFPNAGYPRYHDGRFFYNAAPQYFADAAKEFVAQGAVLIGGCCGVGPEHIRATAQAIAGLKPRRSKPVVQWVAEPELQIEKRPVETSLLSLMDKGQTVIVTELDPPKTLVLEKYFAAARALIDAGSDAITLADNSLAILRVSNLAIGAILKQRHNIMPLLHISCRDKNLIGLQSELMGIAALGIRHILPLTGDPAKFGDQPGASSVYDVNSIQLMEIISGLNKGYNFAGKNIKYPTDFVMGCTFNPNAKNLDAQVARLERKIAAGARYVMTQPVFDKALVQQMHARTKHLQVPILTGIWPLLHARQTEFLHHEVPGIIIPDQIRSRMAGTEGLEGRRQGIEIAKDVVRAALDYFPGIYLITPFLAYDTTAELAQFARSLS
ncbi:MAG TPA: bifunctional homocysteine S-methyltransferase/methylenetetrahydrofolate reductase [Chthoniobacterales bacterium]|jgi:methionine synthase / methylenetetrahydrofolate reductase(NADPH)|nr:bifunctional homocysteine S-methyltransferase/methylenetetrahydrofolate reductase [Chthoniobacterales bacterium]